MTTETIKALRDALTETRDAMKIVSRGRDFALLLASSRKILMDAIENTLAVSHLALTADASEDTPAPAANLDQIALDTAAKILPIYFEPISGVQLKAKIQCVVREAIDAIRPPSGPDWKDAYLNMKAFAESHGLDTVAYCPNGGPIDKVRVSVLRSTLESIYEAMNHMGDALNGMDAVMPDDEKVFPAFDLIRELLESPSLAAPSPARESLSDPRIRAMAIVAGGYQDDETAVWELTDPCMIKLVRAALATPRQTEDGSGLSAAVDAVLREALDNVEVHPCDVNDDAVRAEKLYGVMAQLYKARHAASGSNAAVPPSVQGGVPEGFVERIGHALFLADVLIDAVPTRAQNSENESLASIGEFVNGKGGAYHPIALAKKEFFEHFGLIAMLAAAAPGAAK